ncbi:hypothetical protein IQ250_12525 [Pseudanabaenaceae cyanobacterium LEGE 13415]|nr:hypothetical protein [Pseudanabaenaceae cyanobacterium LEGE 13415]
MAEPTLQEIFGTGATQDANTLTIQKSALAAKGLNSSANNTAESLLTAIMLQAAENLTENARSSDTLNRSMTITYSGQDLLDSGGVTFRRDTFITTLYKQTQLASINPNDY